MGKYKVKVLERESWDNLVVDAIIIKAKSPVVIGTESRKPKPQRMTIQDLANLILPRLDAIETTLKEHAEFNVIVKDYMDTHK